jgi:hypothetical protein
VVVGRTSYNTMHGAHIKYTAQSLKPTKPKLSSL